MKNIGLLLIFIGFLVTGMVSPINADDVDIFVDESTEKRTMLLAQSQTQNLSGVVRYQLKKITESLDKVDYYLNFNAPPKSKWESAKVHLEAAEREYNQILQYERGKFDESHPDYVAVVKRLEKTREAVETFHAEQVLH